jgi:[acyl-carrier-protein] S-malonyltransferase
MVTEPNEALNQTANTQPLMLTAGVATWRAWQAESSLSPLIMAGHSLGEYTALVASGALAFDDALTIGSLSS